MEKIVIAIDGFSACGKSTTATAVAHLLGYTYIDTGAMYRAVTLYFLNNYIKLTDPRQVSKSLNNIELGFEHAIRQQESEIYLNGVNVSKEIREMFVTEKVSEVSALPQVREKLVTQQQKFGKRKGVVVDGRDIGTVVFPEAELKVFIVADLEIRAARRQAELLQRGQLVNLETVIRNLSKRDRLDTSRSVGPLKQAPDAHLIDTTHLTFSEQVEEVLNLATSAMLKLHQSKNHHKVKQV